jgi:hypothetical protein
MNIDKELKKMKDYLEDNIKIRPIEIADYSLGGKHVTFHAFYIINEKMTKLDYSFRIGHFDNPSDNYANAEYLLYVDTSYKDGGSGYAIEYNSIKDFINDDTVKELVGDTEEAEEEIEILEGQMSLFEEETTKEPGTIEEIRFNFDDLEENNDPIEELLSYGIDKHYYEMLKARGCMTFNAIKEELLKLPKYKEYMEKFGKYLRGILPQTTFEELGNDFNKRCLIETDTIGYRINGNRQQYTAYCLQQFMKTTEHKSLF